MENRILILDKDVAGRKYLASILEKEGYDVVSMAKEKVDSDGVISDDFAVVLIDVSMFDGSSITALWKVGKIAPNTMFILLAEEGIDERQIKAMKHQVHDCIQKPIDKQELLSSVTDALALRRKEKRKRILISEIWPFIKFDGFS